MTREMDADTLIDSIRGLVIVVHRDGTIAEARGGFGGFLGVDVAALPGSNVFEHVPEADASDLAMYFIENADESEATIALPMPFRMSIVDENGYPHPVDIVPTGQLIGPDDWMWTVLLMPVALNCSIVRSLDLEMAGAPRGVVRSMLCEELRVDNANYTSRWLLIDLDEPDSPDVLAARPEDRSIAEAVAADLDAEKWRPWEDVARGALASLDVDAFPARTKSMMDANGWRRSIVAPVHVGDRLVAAFLLIGAIPSEFDRMQVTSNVATRVESLVRATAMLIERWHDQDQLQVAATTDDLTGLLNRRELFAKLSVERRNGSMLYVDVDDFKEVNDRFGHAVGDQVLMELSRRIGSACREQDIIGRVGGDEFVIVLPGADSALACEVARRIIDRVAEPLDLDHGPTGISVSIGHSLLCADGAVDAADHAMLRAKRSGRQFVTAVDGD